MEHIFDVQKVGTWLVYSDWLSHKVTLVSMETTTKVDLIQGLMRPTQMYIHTLKQPGKIPLATGCG